MPGMRGIEKIENHETGIRFVEIKAMDGKVAPFARPIGFMEGNGRAYEGPSSNAFKKFLSLGEKNSPSGTTEPTRQKTSPEPASKSINGTHGMPMLMVFGFLLGRKSSKAAEGPEVTWGEKWKLFWSPEKSMIWLTIANRFAKQGHGSSAKAAYKSALEEAYREERSEYIRKNGYRRTFGGRTPEHPKIFIAAKLLGNFLELQGDRIAAAAAYYRSYNACPSFYKEGDPTPHLLRLANSAEKQAHYEEAADLLWFAAYHVKSDGYNEQQYDLIKRRSVENYQRAGVDPEKTEKLLPSLSKYGILWLKEWEEILGRKLEN